MHIFAASRQPLTRFIDPTLHELGASKYTFRTHPRAQVRCHSCGRRRWAKYLVVQVYYDQIRITCREPCRRGR